MKMFFKTGLLLMAIQTGVWLMPHHARAQVNVSFQVFYDDLSPYGTWIENPSYGYVWIPDAGPGFSPYATNGYWIYSDYGWTWVSYYAWGWAPFHYGRWYTDPFYGPVWIPDTQWGPGWVTWRGSPGYYGWASMGPGAYQTPAHEWTFVEVNYFGTTTMHNHYVNSSSNTTIINNTTIITNNRTNGKTIYNSGPEKGEVEKRSGKPVSQVVVKDNKSHGQKVSKGQMQIYKPGVEKTAAGGKKPAPAKVADAKEVKTPEQRKTEPAKQPAAKPADKKAERKAEQKKVGGEQPKPQASPSPAPKADPAPKPTPASKPKPNSSKKGKPN